MIKFSTLFSGSSGNCTYISDGDTNILIDAGVSANKICSALRDIDVSPDEIDAIFITHEHRDHILGTGVLSRRYNIPLYASEDTLLGTFDIVGNVQEHNMRPIEKNRWTEVRSMRIYPFSIPHDAANPYGYTINAEDTNITVATDTGHVTNEMLKSMCKSSMVLIEANHDINMLKNGPYPMYLKKRILGEKGHLSNESAAHLASQLAYWGCTKILLGHLSEHNNTHEKAFSEVSKKLSEKDIKIGKDVLLSVAKKDTITYL